MITLSFLDVLRFPADTFLYDMMYFRPEFLEWCERWPGIEIASVCQDHNPGYQVDLTYDFEISGLSPEDEALWVLRWGKSAREHPVELVDELSDRLTLCRPFSDFSFTVAVPL